MPKQKIKITRAPNVIKRKGRPRYSVRFRIPITPASKQTYWSPFFNFKATGIQATGFSDYKEALRL